MGSRKLSVQKWIELSNRYIAGEKSNLLSQEYGVSTSAITLYLRNKNLPRRDAHRHNKYVFDEHWLDVIDTEEKAYFLGFLYADGNNHEKSNRIQFWINAKDVVILEKFSELLRSTYPIKRFQRKIGNEKIETYAMFSVISKHFASACSRLGAVPKKSLVLKFPSKDQVPEHLLRHFMRGYFDGDGCITFNKKTPTTKRYAMAKIISSKDFCKSYSDAIRDQIGDDISNLVPYRGNVNLGYCAIGGVDRISKFLDLLYNKSSIHLLRKFDKYNDFQKRKIELKMSPAHRSRFFGVEVTKRGIFSSYYYKIDGNRKLKRIGRFSSEEAAARAYDAFCKQNKVNFTKINFTEETIEFQLEYANRFRLSKRGLFDANI